MLVAATTLVLANAAFAHGNGGVIPPVPPVQQSDAVVVPPFTPATPGVTPIDTGTRAIVGSSTADRELRDAVASAIAADPAMRGSRINVLVSAGAVTLSGTAIDTTQATRARTITERLAGSAPVTASITTSG